MTSTIDFSSAAHMSQLMGDISVHLNETNSVFYEGGTLSGSLDLNLKYIFNYVGLTCWVRCVSKYGGAEHDVVHQALPLITEPGYFLAGNYSVQFETVVPDGPPSLSVGDDSENIDITWKLCFTVEKFSDQSVGVNDTIHVVMQEMEFKMGKAWPTLDDNLIERADTLEIGGQLISLSLSCHRLLTNALDSSTLHVKVNILNDTGKKIDTLRMRCIQVVNIRTSPKPSVNTIEVPGECSQSSVGDTQDTHASGTNSFLSPRVKVNSQSPRSSLAAMYNKGLASPKTSIRRFSSAFSAHLLDDKPPGLSYVTQFQKSKRYLSSRAKEIKCVMTVHPNEEDMRRKHIAVSRLTVQMANSRIDSPVKTPNPSPLASPASSRKGSLDNGNDSTGVTPLNMCPSFCFESDHFQVSVSYFLEGKITVSDTFSGKSLRVKIPIELANDNMTRN